ncbi:MAG: hypothetical protein ABMB14_31770 [Myxococcota bacterium]
MQLSARFVAYIEDIQALEPRTWATLLSCFRPVELKRGDAFAPMGQVSHRIGLMERGWIRAIDPEIRHVTIDYPAILADRDYVARYGREVRDGRRILSWTPVEHPSAPPVRGVVRLTAFEGEWQLEATGADTRVRYVWQADPAGDFPDWAMSQAKIRTGYEVLEELAHASGATLVPPEQPSP